MSDDYRAKVNRETMTCSVVKKRAPRPWTAKAVGRVYCEALLSGVSQSEMRDEMKRCGGESECDCEALKETIQQQRDILAALEVFLALLAGLKVVVAVARRAKMSREEEEATALSEAAARDVEKLKEMIRLSQQKLALQEETAFKGGTVNIKP